MSVSYVGFKPSPRAILNRMQAKYSVYHRPEIQVYHHAVCVPLQPSPRGTEFRNGGLISSDGKFVAASGIRRKFRRIIFADALPQLNDADFVGGRSFYIGPCFHHFGHFMIETLGRLWPLLQGGLDQYERFVLLPWSGLVPDFAIEIFKKIGIENRLFVPERPVRFETLDLPESAIELDHRVSGDIAGFSKIFRDVVPEPNLQDTPLFVSRAGIGRDGFARALIGEEIIENALKKNGVRIFRPENHPLIDQVRALKSHRTIIGFAGSALHTLLLCEGRKDIIGYTSRHLPAVFPLIDAALKNNATYIDAGMKLPAGAARVKTGFRPQLLNPDKVLEYLQARRIIKAFDRESLAAPDQQLLLVKRFNTVLMARHLVEIRSSEGLPASREAMRNYSDRYEVDWPEIRRMAKDMKYFADIIPDA